MGWRLERGRVGRLFQHRHDRQVNRLLLATEVDAEQNIEARIVDVLVCIASLIDLLEGSVCIFVKLELDNINVRRRFDYAIEAAIVGVDFALRILPQKEEDEIDQAMVIRFSFTQKDVGRNFLASTGICGS